MLSSNCRKGPYHAGYRCDTLSTNFIYVNVNHRYRAVRWPVSAAWRRGRPGWRSLFVRHLSDLDLFSFVLPPSDQPSSPASTAHTAISLTRLHRMLRFIFVYVCMYFLYDCILHACVVLKHGELDLVGLKHILRTTTSFSALTLLVGSFHP